MMDRAARLRAIVDAFASRTVVVVGDLIADEFLFGKPSRISREAPVLILRFTEREVLMGGAANAAHNVHALGARVVPVGVIGRHPEPVATVLPLPEPIARQDEHALRAHGPGRHEVGRLVAHERGVPEVEAVVGRGALEQAGLRLAAVADRPVRRDTLGRMVDADVDAVEVGPFFLQLSDECGVHRGEDLFGEIAARHARLVGDDHGGDAGLVQPADRLRGAWEEPETLRVVDVPHFLGQRPVTIDEHGRARHHAGSLSPSAGLLKKNRTLRV